MNSHDEVLELDPCVDARWASFVSQHSRASIFHQVPWLKALRETYGYRTVAYCRVSKAGEVVGGISFCELRSWLTGNRLVSLPFSDHCEPLVESADELRQLVSPAVLQMKQRKWKYVEIRPIRTEFAAAVGGPSKEFAFHRLDLRPTTEELFQKLHVDSIRRKIQKATKAGLRLEYGHSEDLLADFYRLHVLTRKRQLSPPHPLRWFRNVLKCLGDNARLRVAYKEQKPAAAVFTLETDTTVIYKYGCSDDQFHRLGAMPFVFWDVIRDGREKNRLTLDLGRSDLDNLGLITFKEKWGALRQPLIYSRMPTAGRESEPESKTGRALRHVIRYCPNWMLAGAGRLLYPHIG